MDVLYPVLWGAVILALIILNMGLCFWMGHIDGRRGRKHRLHQTSMPTGPQAVQVQVPAVVPVIPTTVTRQLQQEKPHVFLAPNYQTPVSKSHRQTLVGITCAPRMVVGQETVQSVSPASYDSDVFTDDPLSPPFEEHADHTIPHIFHTKRK